MCVLVIAEKPSVAQSLSAVIGAKERKDGYLEGNGFRVSWCVVIWPVFPMRRVMTPGMRNGIVRTFRLSRNIGK